MQPEGIRVETAEPGTERVRAVLRVALAAFFGVGFTLGGLRDDQSFWWWIPFTVGIGLMLGSGVLFFGCLFKRGVVLRRDSSLLTIKYLFGGEKAFDTKSIVTASLQKVLGITMNEMIRIRGADNWLIGVVSRELPAIDKLLALDNLPAPGGQKSDR